MKKLFVLLLLAIPYNAVADETLLKKYNCTACHQNAVKIVGPAYKDVAAKYKGQNYTDKLAAKIKSGGAGSWGQMPMPPHPQVSDTDAKKMAEYILALK
jgi:cytochrome c